MELIKADVTVVGGGIAGICAAIAAARQGLQVSLINDRPVLGGNASSEVRVHINGSAYLGNSPSYYAREGGLVEELKLKIFHYNPLYNKKLMLSLSDTVLLDMVYGEANIALFLNTCVHETGMENGRIKWVEGLQLASERKFRFESRTYIDCSGDGIVGYQAGAHFRQGREAKHEYKEELAPEVADHYTMGDTILFQARDVGYSVPYQRPGFAYDITKLAFFDSIRQGLNHRSFPRKINGLGGLWWLEYGGHLDIIKNNEEIALELRKLVYGIWDYIKNSGEFDDVANLILDYVCPIPGKRSPGGLLVITCCPRTILPQSRISRMLYPSADGIWTYMPIRASTMRGRLQPGISCPDCTISLSAVYIHEIFLILCSPAAI